MIKGKSQPLSWILKIPIYHNQLLNCKINVEYNTLSMQLSLEGRLGSMTGTQLSWPLMEIQVYSSLRGCHCLENSLAELGPRAAFLFWSQMHISDHFITALLMAGSSILANEVIPSGKLLCSSALQVQVSI